MMDGILHDKTDCFSEWVFKQEDHDGPESLTCSHMSRFWAEF